MSSQSETPRETADVEKWIAAARAGDRQALGRLLETCQHYLMLIANEELAPAIQAKVAPSDIVQDTFLEAGRDFPRFQGTTEKELLGWLRQILRNNTANLHRHFESEKCAVEREVVLDSALLPGAVKQTETPSVRLRACEQDEQLERAMRLLSEPHRQVLRMHTSEGLTFVQIAEKWNSTAEAVRKLWGRAVVELTKLLETPHELP